MTSLSTVFEAAYPLIYVLLYSSSFSAIPSTLLFPLLRLLLVLGDRGAAKGLYWNLDWHSYSNWNLGYTT